MSQTEDYLEIVEDRSAHRIAWVLVEDGDSGMTLGEGGEFTEEDLGPMPDADTWENVMAHLAAQRSPGVSRDDRGFWWSTKREARAALALINASLRTRSSRPWPEWATKAAEAGWKPPRGWKP